MDTLNRPPFSSSYNKGFHFTFSNGWTISVQWGPMNYCDHSNFPESRKGDYFEKFENWLNSPHQQNLQEWSSNTAEVCIWYDEVETSVNPDTLQPPDDENYQTVKGWATPEEVAELIYKVSKLQPMNDPVDELLDVVDVMIDTSTEGGKEFLNKMMND